MFGVNWNEWNACRLWVLLISERKLSRLKIDLSSLDLIISGSRGGASTTGSSSSLKKSERLCSICSGPDDCFFGEFDVPCRQRISGGAEVRRADKAPAARYACDCRPFFQRRPSVLSSFPGSVTIISPNSLTSCRVDFFFATS